MSAHTRLPLNSARAGGRAGETSGQMSKRKDKPTKGRAHARMRRGQHNVKRIRGYGLTRTRGGEETGRQGLEETRQSRYARRTSLVHQPEVDETGDRRREGPRMEQAKPESTRRAGWRMTTRGGRGGQRVERTLSPSSSRHGALYTSETQQFTRHDIYVSHTNAVHDPRPCAPADVPSRTVKFTVRSFARTVSI